MTPSLPIGELERRAVGDRFPGGALLGDLDPEPGGAVLRGQPTRKVVLRLEGNDRQTVRLCGVSCHIPTLPAHPDVRICGQRLRCRPVLPHGRVRCETREGESWRA